MLVALGDLEPTQAQPTEDMWSKIVRIINYAATHPDAEIKYQARDMCMHTDGDASYLSSPKVRSTASMFFFLSAVHPKLPQNIHK